MGDSCFHFMAHYEMINEYKFMHLFLFFFFCSLKNGTTEIFVSLQAERKI